MRQTVSVTWHPISRKPRDPDVTGKDGRYLVTYEGGEIGILTRYKSVYGGCYWLGSSKKPVIAWAILPKHYAASKEANP